MIISKEIEISMAHRICYHNSKCRSLHGHRYKIEVAVDGDIHDKAYSSDYGMVVDYSDLKALMMKYIDEPFDHGAVFYKLDPFVDKLSEMMALGDQNPKKLHFVDFMPTAENLCKFWFNELKEPLKKLHGIDIEYVKVWETPTSTAIYTK